MDRRSFIKSTCSVCMIGAAGLITTQLSSCGPGAFSIFKADVIDRKITIPLVAFQKSSLQIIRSKDLFYDMAVQKKDESTYEALMLLCSHQENQLTVTGNGYSCSLHGSQFDKNGNVIKGPASIPLKQFPTFISDNKLVIEL